MKLTIMQFYDQINIMLNEQKIPTENIKKILSNYNLGKINNIKPISTSGNIAYVIKSDNGKYFFRLSPYGSRWRSKNEILAEIELIDYLAKNKFPVTEPIIARNMKTIISWKNHFGYIREFDNGYAKLNPNNKEIAEFGKILGFFHSLVKNYKTTHKRKHIWDLKETQKNFKESKKIILESDFKNKEKFVEKLEKELFSLHFPDKLSSGMIHEDLGKRHVIWKKNKIAGFIDFDRSYYGKLILDLGQACRGWCFTNNWRKWSNDNFKSLITSYESKRKLTKFEKKYLIDAVRFAVLERSLSFCLRYINVTRDTEDEKFAWNSIADDGLIGMIDKNKEKIEEIIRAV